MGQALILILEGGQAWDRIALRTQSFLQVLLLRLFPMLVITAVLEGLGLRRWGKWRPELRSNHHFSDSQIIGYEVTQLLFYLALILFCTRVVLKLGHTFTVREPFSPTRALTAVVYGFSPLFLLRLLDPFPAMNPYVTWGIGITLVFWVLYEGLPRLLQPDPSHAMGLYLSCGIVFLLSSLLVRILTALFLRSDWDFLNTSIGRNLLELLKP
jgi:hypothetical protein